MSLPNVMSYLRNVGTDIARGAGSVNIPRSQFVQGSDGASVRRRVRPARGQGFEGGRGRRWDFAWRRRDRDGARHFHGHSESVGEVGAGVDGRGGAAVAKLLPLLPLVQLPHHPFLGGQPLVCGHAEVAQPVVGVLIVTGQVA